MATSKTVYFIKRNKKKNKGVHSKNSQSSNKGSKNYSKPYVGQGR
jgi:hypothetical protein